MKVCIDIAGCFALAALLASGCDQPEELAEVGGATELLPVDGVDDGIDPSTRGGDDFEVEEFALEGGISRGEARARLVQQALAPDLAVAARVALGDSFGGVWVDDDEITVGVTSLGEVESEAVRRAAARVGLDDAYRLVQVRFSLEELEQVNDLLADRLAAINTGEGPGLIAGLRTDLNAVELEVPARGRLSAAQRELVSSAEERFGDLLVIDTYEGAVIPLACKYPYCAPPLRGGIRIWKPDAGCTGGFVAASKSDGKLYQVTAGHCALGNKDDWYTFFPDLSKHVIGPTWNWKYGLDGDMAILRIDNVLGWQPKPWVNVTNGPDTTSNPSYSVSSDKTSVIGMRICATGASLGHSTCGKVTKLGVTVTYEDGPTLKGLGVSSTCAIPGDSGAPMFSWHVAYGIVSGGVEGQCITYYQGIQAAENAMNVNLVHG